MGEVVAACPAALVGLISDNKTEHCVPYTDSYRALGVSESWFRKWRETSGEQDSVDRRSAASHSLQTH
ncbi:hypothetical protein [Streptomyces sp. NPDC057702]|uniref:hypothetical protein n=1 Tax=unclassified Streptomyces TaxID=2593676 RepID=UPI0036B884DA